MFDEEEFDWRAALRLVGMDDDYIAQYNNVPILHITREEDIAPWSPEVDSPNPFVAVQKLLMTEGYLDRTTISSEAFWAGSEESTKFWPNMLLGCLRKTEKYIKDFVYRNKSSKDRVATWLERGVAKYHFPGAPHITVDSAVGYNMVGTFQTTEWSPIMLSTEVIPSAKNEERLWASTLLAILSYSYYVNDLKIEGEQSVFTSRHRKDKSIMMDAEKEMQDMAKEALSYLSGKKGIQFIPPRPGYDLPSDQFLIPSFPTCSKKDWSGQHFVLALTESIWILNAGERDYSKMMINFRAQCDTQALEGARPSPRGEAKAKAEGVPPKTTIPKHARKDLRKAAREGQAHPVGEPSSAAHRSTSTDTDPGTAGRKQRSAGPKHSESVPRYDQGSSRDRHYGTAAPSDTTWDEANWEEQPWSKASKTWSSTRSNQWEPTSGTQWSESTQWDTPKGKGPQNPKGKGGSKGNKGPYKGSK